MALKGIINLLQKARAGMQKFSAYPEQQSGLDEIDNISKKVLKDTNPETKTPLQTQSKQTQALTVLDANQQAEIALIDKNNHKLKKKNYYVSQGFVEANQDRLQDATYLSHGVDRKQLLVVVDECTS